jgi:hypothetical protein
MAVLQKYIQPELPGVDRIDIERAVECEKDRQQKSMASQIRLLLHTSGDISKRLDVQEELIGALLDYIFERKTP